MFRDDESVINKISPSRGSYLIIWYIFSIVTIFPIGIFVLPFLEIYVRANTYYLTTERVLSEYKFLSKNQTSIPYEQITDLSPRSSFFNRILGCGTVHVQTAGADVTEVKLENIKNPQEVANMISKQVKERNEGTNSGQSESQGALEKLKEKFVEGEINEKEYKRKKEIIDG